ncbi:hypothetical protein PSTG_08643 [Puccinia striiformis f. sp. tritici PST-78]|uniref:Uncharacterized protein n=1 Tax=Puccinia striiformis f. sp. tritici PST-78 TaxID=1165861 RepID=A0A0L0VFK8_9BASI|nr:hypothetical protein PSTG_08643 [Puccinia striiformis f. sp. tritici PST-78]
MGLQRRQEDIENFDEGEGADLLEECIKQIHLTSEGSNTNGCKTKLLLGSRGFEEVWAHHIWLHQCLELQGIGNIRSHNQQQSSKHIGYYYLQLVKEVGGIPQRTTTDRGTETIDLAGHQMNLMGQFGSIDPDKCHQFTNCVHNQKLNASGLN